MPYIELPGVHLWYNDTGGSGTPVVFMHAASGTCDSWVYQLPVFTAAGYRCVTYDRWGWGRSRPDPTGSAAWLRQRRPARTGGSPGPGALPPGGDSGWRDWRAGLRGESTRSGSAAWWSPTASVASRTPPTWKSSTGSAAGNSGLADRVARVRALVPRYQSRRHPPLD